ncbi:MAG: hypothetical protein HRT53_15345 [Colwellia sp.]|nr:hypothetical protein [Colwellia sp.]
MNNVYRIFAVFSVFFLYIPASYAGKTQCQPYLDKLRNVQSQQRQGHSFKRSEALNKRETKARKKWWQCERGLLKTTKSRQNKKQQSTKVIKKHQLATYTKKNGVKLNQSPFQTSNALVIKSRYQGKQLQAWLKYYQQPKQCQRPKTTKQFAFCVENRRSQQMSFEK